MTRLLIVMASLIAMVASFYGATFMMERIAVSDFPAVSGPSPEIVDVPDSVRLPRVPKAEASTPRATSRPTTSEQNPDAFIYELAEVAQRREKAERDAILVLPVSDEAPIDRKLRAYQRAVHDSLDDAPAGQVLNARGALTEVFLRMDTVQKDLAALSPATRQRELAHIRREMGFEEEEIERLEELDEYRESRWSNGLAYMEERRRVIESFKGDAARDELHHLRKEYFAHEEKTIRLEEKDGFFRYERPRIYGRN